MEVPTLILLKALMGEVQDLNVAGGYVFTVVRKKKKKKKGSKEQDDQASREYN